MVTEWQMDKDIQGEREAQALADARREARENAERPYLIACAVNPLAEGWSLSQDW